MKLSKLYMVAALAGATLLTACDDFIDVPPTGVINDDIAYSSPDEMVTAAYAMLGNCWYSYPFNLWPYGDVASDDAMKGGSGVGDTGYHPFEVWSSLTNDRGELDELWYRLYCNISRCNRALIALDAKGVEKLGEEKTTQRKAEVKFLRAHNYFKLLRIWYNVPWIDEKVVNDGSHEKINNFAEGKTDEQYNAELWQKVIADLEEAYKVLPEAAPGTTGRAHKAAAAAYLAKIYLNLAYGDGYEKNNKQGKVNEEYLKKVLAYTEDVTKSGYDYLDDFGDIFLPDHKNSKESVFAIQTSDYESDGTKFGRANWSNMLNGCWGIWSCGWDFNKPTMDLVNAFKTKDGLPDFDGWNKSDDYPVNGHANDQKWDPRLFHTVGMPTFPYKYEAQYTLTMDNSRNPGDYGYFASMKEVPQRSKGETFDQPWQAFDMNDYVFRYTDVMLWRAEALVELGEPAQLAQAMDIINAIRLRAKASIGKHIAYAADQCDIATYSSFPNQEYARKAVRWERRLEMAMEHERFFDLRRWGVASTTLNAFFKHEAAAQYEGKNHAAYYNGAFFTTEKNEYWPIAYNQLYYVPGLYHQNRGYQN